MPLARDTRHAQWFAVLLCLLLLPVHFLAAQTEAKEKPDEVRQRDEWFAHSRRLHGRLPSDLRIKAFKQLEQMRANEKARFAQRFGAVTATQAATITSSSPGDFSLAATQTPWTPIGPAPALNGNTLVSGRITAIAIDPQNTSVIYAGAADGGVWKSVNGGTNWAPLTDQQNSLSTGSIELDPSNSSIVYVGTGEGNGNADAVYGAGILKSTDAGASWQNIQSPFVTSSVSLPIGSIAIDPANSSIVLAGTRSLAGASSGVGIYRSTDGATTWAQVNTNDVFSIKFLPNNPSVVLAAGFDDNASKKLIFRSTDAGATWQEVLAVPVDSVFGPSRAGGSIAVASGHNTIYAALGGNAVTDLYKSTDEGATWTAINNKNSSGGTLCAAQCFYNDVIAVHPTNPNLVFFGGQDLYRSADGGSTWVLADTPHEDYHALEFTPDGGTLFAGTDGGMWSTADPTATIVAWTDLNQNLATLQFYPGISISPGNPHLSLGGVQDNGTLKYTGSTQWNEVLGGDGLQTALDPGDPSHFYTTSEDGNVWETTNGGSSFNLEDNGLNFTSPPPNFFTVLTLDPHNTSRLYTAPNNIYRSDTGASSWVRISQIGLCGSVNNIAVAPSNANVVYVSNGDCLAVSTNATASTPTWTNPFDPGQVRSVTWVAPDLSDATIAYAVLGGFSAGDGQGHVYKVTNSGATWTNITGNLPDVPMSGLVIDPAVANTLYVATDIGVFSTSDGGQTWNSMVTNLPRSAVLGLALDPSTRTLLAATHGRSAYSLQLPGTTGSSCQPLSTVPSVHICSPTNGSTDASPVPISAAAHLANAINSMQVWIDGVKKFQQVGVTSISTSLSIASGTHRVAVLAVDTSNHTTESVVNITVSPTTTTGTLSGTVVNATTNAAIAGATVSFSGGTTTTSSTGSYTFNNVAAGTYTVAASASGFSSGSQSATVTGGQTTTLNFGLTPATTGCQAPGSPGVNICSPVNGSTVNSPVTAQAAGTVSGTLHDMELWVDGVKKFGTTSNTLSTQVSLAPGTHRFAFIAINTAGQKWESVSNATVH